jgi:hypothetical protein
MLKAAERSWDRPWKVHATRFRSFGASDEACLPASQITVSSTQDSQWLLHRNDYQQ